jgi:SAD/SRA domain
MPGGCYPRPVSFGEIPNSPPGTTYRSYREMIDAGVHRQNIVGMVGNPKDGTESIVLSGGYPDDVDRGNEVLHMNRLRPSGFDTTRGSASAGLRADSAPSTRGAPASRTSSIVDTTPPGGEEGVSTL